mgnify:CR=1 FL=1
MRDYIEFMCSIAKFTRAKTIVEVGVETGTSFLGFAETFKYRNDMKLLGFDLWEQHGLVSQFPKRGSKEYVDDMIKDTGFKDYTLTRVDTINKRDEFETKLDELLDGREIDLAFVDADHSYVGIKNDFEVVYKRLSAIGIIVFHDTLMIDGCREFMIDLRTKYFDGTFDIVDFPFGHGDRFCGVSVLFKRTFPLVDRPIDQICGSISSPDDIEIKEVEWLNGEMERYKHADIYEKITKDDMCDSLYDKDLRPKRNRKWN